MSLNYYYYYWQAEGYWEFRKSGIIVKMKNSGKEKKTKEGEKEKKEKKKERKENVGAAKRVTEKAKGK